MDISGVSTIVTGGASGLGAATAHLLASRGARVTIFDADLKKGREVAAEVGGVFCQVDISEDAHLREAFAEAEAAHGIARVLVNCAGYVPYAKVVGDDGAAHAPEIFARSVQVNLLGTLLPLARFSARLATIERLGEERGVIVNTASIAAFDGQVGLSAYAAAKAGVVGVTLPAARDLAPLGIRVVTIAPGMFRTPIIDMMTDGEKDALGRQQPFPNRLGNPAEFAMLVESIIANPMLNGEVIRIDAAHRLRD